VPPPPPPRPRGRRPLIKQRVPGFDLKRVDAFGHTLAHWAAYKGPPPPTPTQAGGVVRIRPTVATPPFTGDGSPATCLFPLNREGARQEAE